ncbi:MAG: penicillin-insensitive murein endopeptidase [Deltaproteobacteria bacterium]|nr:penicillin-insensitive murein endopeptidase [Deltaproteobacteria bacterium]
MSATDYLPAAMDRSDPDAPLDDDRDPSSEEHDEATPQPDIAKDANAAIGGDAASTDSDDDFESSDDDASDDDESDDDDGDESVSASDDDDDDEYDDDDAEYEDDAEDTLAAEAETQAPKRSLGPTLIALGGGVWAIAAALRCGAPEPGPALSVSPDAAQAVADEPEPAQAQPRPAPADEPSPADEPTPAADAVDADADADRPEPDEAEDDDDAPIAPIPEDWAVELSPPKTVHYTVRHGGSIKNVANLFKIYHHEITALNPGFALEKELPPDSRVVVYVREEGTPSESVGIPSSGSLEGAVPMLEGPGRHLKAIPWKSWGTEHTVTLLDQVLRRWAERGKGVQPVLVGNMAARKGGKLPPHSTHQSGRDVDLGYIQKLPKGDELNWRTMTKQNLDAEETWALIRLLHSTGEVEMIFIDTSIQRLLYDHAIANGTIPKAQLSRWLEYPRSPPRRGALVQHVAGHVDHLHVRFRCQPHESRCKSRKR